MSSLDARHVAHNALPIIDISGLRSSDPAAREAVGKALHSACRDKGFFYISHHGIDPVLQQRVFEEAQHFFALPDSEKRKVDKAQSNANRGYEPLGNQTLEANAPPDLKEGYYIGPDLPLDAPEVLAGKFNFGPNQWPERAAFKSAMLDYSAAVTELSELLMEGLALSLNLPADYFDEFCRDANPILRLLHYPPQPANPQPNEKGCGAHTDWGGVTLLLQDDNPGLQVWDQETQAWLHADPIPGTYVVNLGDMIARWTNDLYRSTLHRVVNISGRERFSVPFFYSGNPNHEVRCLPVCLAEGESPRYAPVTVEQHMIDMYRTTYA